MQRMCLLSGSEGIIDRFLCSEAQAADHCDVHTCVDVQFSRLPGTQSSPDPNSQATNLQEGPNKSEGLQIRGRYIQCSESVNTVLI